MADQQEDFLDDGRCGLPEGAGIILVALGAVLFWLGFGAGLAVAALLS